MMVYRLFTAGEYDKREKWINEMCKKGYALKDLGMFKYEFEKCPPGEYYYCLELLENLPSNPENQDYINFLRDEWKIEYVASNCNWAVFRRKEIGGRFSLFSTMNTKISYFKRIVAFRIFVISLLLFLGFSNILLSPPNSGDIVFSVLEILIAISILIFNIPTFVKLYRLKKAAPY
ncbi:MAG: DUF2812 domain-containing protein [Terrisporobacter sp.]|uniref:DUF2812 domain-containing protein n=1 Tax=Terrisporobacter sp. TaxID=1965305 RepID=UPI002FCC3866